MKKLLLTLTFLLATTICFADVIMPPEIDDVVPLEGTTAYYETPAVALFFAMNSGYSMPVSECEIDENGNKVDPECVATAYYDRASLIAWMKDFIEDELTKLFQKPVNELIEQQIKDAGAVQAQAAQAAAEQQIRDKITVEIE